MSNIVKLYSHPEEGSALGYDEENNVLYFGNDECGWIGGVSVGPIGLLKIARKLTKIAERELENNWL